jgi:F-type H+-transporting ATPase subunit alpha
MSVEKQTAIIFCGTKGLLQNVPLNKIGDFEETFLHHLELNHKGILTALRKGQYTDEIANTLESVAKEIALGFEK